MFFSEALNGYLLDARSRKLSQNTLSDYLVCFRKFSSFIGGDSTLIETVTPADIRRFLSSLSVANKTIRNHHAALSALWQWAKLEGIVPTNIVRDVKAPRPDSRVIVPFSEDEIRRMLRASVRATGCYKGKTVTFELPFAKRNRAILLFLLDTGVRASELCDLKIGDCDLDCSRVRIMGKGRKERIIEFSALVGKHLWRYLSERKGHTREDPLFATAEGRKLNRNDLARLIRRIGARAGVQNAHPHRWRHTFAVMALMNGMDVFTLQSSLGHSSFEMSRRYLNVAQVDTNRIQRRASPVANLGL